MSSLFGDDRLPERFWGKVEAEYRVPWNPELVGPCWIWTAGTRRDGYGWFRFGGKPCRAHRVAYKALVGEIPKRLVTDHLCRVRHCVNPEHLEPVTDRENALRGDTIAARRVAQTHCVHGHKFSEENTYRARDGRRCRTCSRRRKQEFDERQRAIRQGLVTP